MRSEPTLHVFNINFSVYVLKFSPRIVNSGMCRSTHINLSILCLAERHSPPSFASIICNWPLVKLGTPLTHSPSYTIFAGIVNSTLHYCRSLQFFFNFTYLLPLSFVALLRLLSFRSISTFSVHSKQCSKFILCRKFAKIHYWKSVPNLSFQH